MRLSTTIALFFVASAMFVAVFMTGQEAAAANDRLFALGRGTDNALGVFANQTTLLEVTLDPFGAAAVGATQDVPLNGLAFQPGTGTLYVSSSLKGTDGLNGGPGFRSLYTMDPVTAETTLVGSFGFGTILENGSLLRSLTFDADGTLYGTDVEQLFSIDLTTGLATVVGGPYADGDPFLGDEDAANIESIAFDPTSGTLYGLSWNDVELFTIDTTTGAATSQGAFADLNDFIPGFVSMAGFAIDSGGNMYASTGSQRAQVFSIDKSDFSHVELGDVNDFVGPEVFAGSAAAMTFELAPAGPAADFDLDGDVDGGDFLVWQQGLGTAYTATDLANWEAEFGTLTANVVVSAVPEPSAVVLLMLGAIGWVSSRKASRNSAYGKI